jgi:hypothetical protein
LTRKSTPQTLQKLGKSPRDRERGWEEDHWFEDERESFPQYWYVPTSLLSFLGSSMDLASPEAVVWEWMHL